MQRLNSASLKERFVDLYTDFFSRSSTVVSCPASFWIVGEHVTLRGSMGAKQNLPLRVYCGVSPNSGKPFHVSRRMLVYLPSKGQFEEHALPDALCEQFEREFEPICSDLFKRSPHGIVMSFLSEAPISSGLGVSGTMTAAALAALAVRFGALDAQQLARITAKSPHVGEAPDHVIDRLFRMAWYLDSVAQEGVSSGAASLCALMGASVPIIYGVGGPLPREKPEFLSTPYCAFVLPRLFSERRGDRWAWPITFGLIYSGARHRPTGAVVRGSAWVKKRASGISGFWHRVFRDVESGKRPGAVLSMDGDEMWRRYTDTMAILTADTIKLMADLFEQGAQLKDFDRFVRNINLYQHAMAYMELSTPAIDRLVARAATNRAMGIGSLAVKITGAGGGGDVVVFAQRGDADAVDRLVAAVNRESDASIVLDYLEERDGLDGRGAVVESGPEQHLAASVCRVTIWDRGRPEALAVPEAQLEATLAEFDLALDKRNRTVRVRGRKLTGPQVVSRKVTVVVVPHLLENSERFVSSKELRDKSPETNYLKFKGELNARVIEPLNRALRSHVPTALELIFEDTGHESFRVRLKPPRIRIAVV